jgi:glycosyltransferase involved in cell wall biosynthesis/Tfp pilus assembly protein PilF
VKEPRVSLCMIVKDEEQMLPRCLSSVRDYVDEIVVVDTGSTDRSVEIAESFGARVIRHPWEDDFSKHRNQSLSYAGGDWFMVLDGDEEILDGTGPLIRRAVRDQDVDSITFEVISLYGGGKKSLHTQQRLFRMDRGIHFEGRIHNRIVGVQSTRLYPIRVLHHGYDVDYEKARMKHERRIRILKREIRDDPGNPIHHHFLAVSHLSAPDYDQAAEEAVLALALAEERGEAGSFFYAWTHYVAVSSLSRLGRFDEALRFCTLGLSRFPEDPDILFTRCEIAFHREDSSALDEFTSGYLSLHERLTRQGGKAGQIHWVTYDQSWKVPWFQAMDRLRTGDHQGFRQEMERALRQAPRKSEVYHATGRHYMEQKDFTNAGAELDKAFAAEPQNLDILYSHIELAIHRQDEEEEIRWWEELLNRFPDKKNTMLQQVSKALDEARWNDARKLLEALLHKDAADGEALPLLIRLGLLLLQSGRMEESERSLARALPAATEDPSLHLGLSAIGWQRGMAESCVAELDQVLRLLELPMDREIHEVEELGEIFAHAAEEFLQRQALEASILSYRLALDMNCRLPQVHQGLARALVKAGQVNASMEQLRLALQSVPLPS